MSERPTRREMLRRMGAAGLTIAGVAGGAAWLAGRPYRRAPAPMVVPSFAAPAAADAPDLVIAGGDAPAAMVRAALAAMGGMEAFVRPGDVVLVKPNAAFDRPAWQGATTSPEVLGAVVAACVGAGAKEVRVTDHPIHAPEGCFRKTGLGRAAEDAGGRVVLPAPGMFRPVSLPGTVLDGFDALLGPLDGVTKVIGVAPVKDHNLARASLTLKNWYGLLGGPRNRLHQRIDEAIAALGSLVRPTLSILDATRILVRNGPTGGSPDDVIAGDRVAIATDPVALDAWGAELLGLAPDDIGWLRLAEERGLGRADWRATDWRDA